MTFMHRLEIWISYSLHSMCNTIMIFWLSVLLEKKFLEIFLGSSSYSSWFCINAEYTVQVNGSQFSRTAEVARKIELFKKILESVWEEIRDSENRMIFLPFPLWYRFSRKLLAKNNQSCKQVFQKNKFSSDHSS